MTEQHETQPEDPDTRAESDVDQDVPDQDVPDQDQAATEIEDQAADLRRRGADARPQAENPVEVAPQRARTQ